MSRNVLLMIGFLLLFAGAGHMGFRIGQLAPKECYHAPSVGDVYAIYYDWHQSQYCITNGMPLETFQIQKVVGISNGLVYCMSFGGTIDTKGKYPYPYNLWGPESNFYRYRKDWIKIPAASTE